MIYKIIGDTMAEAILVQRQDHCVSRRDISDPALKVMRRLRDQGYIAYLAGGAVRDLLLGRTPKDFDVVTDAHLHEIKKTFRNCRLIGRRFRLAHVYFHNEVIEVSTFRCTVDPESQEEHGSAHKRHEDGMILRDNVFGTPEEDALRRDFTVNALFYDSKNFHIIDYAGGLKDIEQRVIRCIGDPMVRYTEDPVRMIRAARFAGTLGFDIEKETYDAILASRDQLSKASPSRLYEEIQKLFLCGHAEAVFHILDTTGLFRVLFPDFGRFLDEQPGEKNWVERIMAQLDIWRAAGKTVSPGLMLALMFGGYHEYLAKPAAKGKSELTALRDVVDTHIGRLRQRINVPRVVSDRISAIMTLQPSLKQVPCKRAARLRQRPCFLDAFIYFKLSIRHEGCGQEALDWWTDHV